MLERTEEVVFTLSFNKDTLKKKDADFIASRRGITAVPNLIAGDVLEFHYKVYIEYFDTIAETLKFILKNKDKLTNVTYEELKHGESLIMEIAKLLGKFEEKKK